MIDAIEPLSLVLWGVFALAAGMYPLGFMLGSSCSACCESDCEPLFHRCLRVKSVDGKPPMFLGSWSPLLRGVPSFEIFYRSDAGLSKASESTTADVAVTVPSQFAYLLGGETLQLSARLVITRRFSEVPTGVVNTTDPVEVPITIIGRDFPIVVSELFAPAIPLLAATGLVPLVYATASDNGTYRNKPRVPTVSVVAATTNAPIGYLSASTISNASLMAMLTVSPTRYWDGWMIGLSANLGTNAFRYVPSTTPFTVTWLVQIQNGTMTTYFEYKASIGGKVTAATPLPSDGLVAPVISPLPAYQAVPDFPATIPPVINGNGMTFYTAAVAQTATATVAISLDGTACSTCTPGNFTGAEGVSCVFEFRDTYPNGLNAHYISGRLDGEYVYITPTIGSLPLDKWVVNGAQANSQWFSEMLASVYEYDIKKTEKFINGEIALRMTTATQGWVDGILGGTRGEILKHADVWVEEYSPLCAMKLCDAPQELLPTGITYTPAEGEKYGCKDAYEFVLGAPDGGCTYSHTANECMGSVSKSIGLLEFFKQYTLTGATDVMTVDILTWLEYEPEPLVRFGATYTVGGEYDPTKGRYGKCLAHGAAFAHDREGECMAAEVTVTIGDLSPEYSLDPITDPVMASGKGDYVLRIDGGGCDRASYVFSTPYQSSDPHGKVYWGLQYVTHETFGNGQGIPFCENPGCPHVWGTVGFVVGEAWWSSPWSGNFNSRSEDCDRFDPGGWIDKFSSVHVHIMTRVNIGGSSTQPVLRQYATTISVEDGEPMTKCSSVTYEPTEATIKSGESVTVTPTGDDPLCRGLPITYGPLINTIAEPRIYNRLATSDGSPPTPIEITVEGECTAVPVSGNAQFSFQGWGGPLVATPTYAFSFNPMQGDVQGSRCMMIPIKTNGAECAWTATSKSEWLVIEEGTETGTGDGRINVQVAAHTVVTTQEQMAGGRRTGTIEITTDGETPKTVVATIKQG